MMNEHAGQGGFKGRDRRWCRPREAGRGGEDDDCSISDRCDFRPSLTLVFAGQSHATVFAAWQVANVPFGDTLNVPEYPSGASQKQAANGTVLQMTGRCSGGGNLLDIANQTARKQQQTVRYR